MKKRIFTTITFLALMLLCHPLTIRTEASQIYRADDCYSYFEVKDNAGNYIKDGKVKIYGPIVEDNGSETVTVEGREWYDLWVSTNFYYPDGEILTVRGARSESDYVGFEYQYSFEDFTTYVAPKNGTYRSDSGSQTLSFTVDRCDVELLVSLRNANGDPVTSGVTVTVDGTSDIASPYEFFGLTEGKKYTISVSGNGYSATMDYTVERDAQKRRSTEVNIGKQAFDVYVKPMLGGQTIEDLGYMQISSGSVSLVPVGGIGSSLYHAKLPAGSNTFSVGGAFKVTENATVNITGSNSESSPIILELGLNQPEFSASSRMFYGTSQTIDTDTLLGLNYSLASSDPSVIATSDSSFGGGSLRAVGVGDATVTLTVSFGNASNSWSKMISVRKASANMPSGTIVSGDTDADKIQLQLPEGTAMEGVKGLTLNVSGKDINGNNLTFSRTYSDVTSGQVIDISFDEDKMPFGPVTIEQVFTSDIYEYNQASQSITKNFYRDITKLGAQVNLDKTAFVFNGKNQTPTASVSGLPEGTYEITTTATAAVTPAGNHSIKVTGQWFKGELTAPYTVEKYTITVTARDQDVVYPNVDTTAYDYTPFTCDGVRYDVNATVEPDGLTLKVKDPVLKLTTPAADPDGTYAETYGENIRIITEDGSLIYRKSTPVIMLDASYGTQYTYGEVPGLPGFTVTGALKTDVEFSWSVKASSRSNQWTSAADAPKSAGTYTLTALIQDTEYTNAASTSVDITISPAPVRISAVSGTKVYDGKGSNVKATGCEFTGLQHNDELTLGTDYTISNMVLTPDEEEKYGVGTYEMTASVALKGDAAKNYTLENQHASGTAQITACPIADVTAAPIEKLIYSGEAHTPDVSLTYGGMTLAETTDYTLSYADNVAAGTAKITVTGVGNYSGTRELSFTIVPKVLERSWVTVTNYDDENPFVYNGKKDPPRKAR